MKTESIYSSKSVMVPLGDVQHIEHLTNPEYGSEGYINRPTGRSLPNGIWVITDKTKWDFDADCWANPIYLSEEEKQDFLSAWSRYRDEPNEIKKICRKLYFSPNNEVDFTTEEELDNWVDKQLVPTNEKEELLKMVKESYNHFGDDSSGRKICRLEKEIVGRIEKVLNPSKD